LIGKALSALSFIARCPSQQISRNAPCLAFALYPSQTTHHIHHPINGTHSLRTRAGTTKVQLEISTSNIVAFWISISRLSLSLHVADIALTNIQRQQPSVAASVRIRHLRHPVCSDQTGRESYRTPRQFLRATIPILFHYRQWAATRTIL
jgi:hypothetical protein